MAGSPRRVSSAQLADTGVIASYDVAPGGRVLALLPPEPAGAAGSLVLVTNFRDIMPGARRNVPPAFGAEPTEAVRNHR